MIKVNNKIYRNIQEQVQANKEAIEAFSSVEYTLNNFGIKVLGVREDEPTGTNFEFGDAYLVGTTAPYEMYIFTRNDDPTVSGTWVNIGNINLVGEVGPTGPMGPAGSDGYAPVVRYGAGLPIVESEDKDGYLYINTSTDQLFTFNNHQWHFVINMKGAKGDRGERGIQGATGTTLSIVGKLSSPSLLPTNFQTGAIPKNSAYLVDVQGANHLYIILGDQGDYSTWYWKDAGDFNLGSVLYDDAGTYIQYKSVTDEYDTDTGSLVTDIATNTLYEELSSVIADKVDGQEFTEAITSKASIATTNALSDRIDDIVTNINANYLTKDDAADTYIAKEATGEQFMSCTTAGGEVLCLNNKSTTASHTWLRLRNQGNNVGEYGVKNADGTPRYYNAKTGAASDILTTNSAFVVKESTSWSNSADINDYHNTKNYTFTEPGLYYIQYSVDWNSSATAGVIITCGNTFFSNTGDTTVINSFFNRSCGGILNITSANTVAKCWSKENAYGYNTHKLLVIKLV